MCFHGVVQLDPLSFPELNLAYGSLLHVEFGTGSGEGVCLVAATRFITHILPKLKDGKKNIAFLGDG